MTFTYSPFSADRDRVRFHIGDTDSAAAMFSDEEIAAIITEAGGWRAAVIYCLESLIASVSGPDFRADWLTVDNSKARAGYEALLKLKRRAFGLSKYAANVTHVYRADSNQTSEPDYAAAADEDSA